MAVAEAPADLWCVSTHYCLGRGKERLAAYLEFAAGIANAGMNLLTVELVFPHSTRRLPSTLPGQVVVVHARDVLWHKEALLNYGLGLLPRTCAGGIAIDGDLRFDQEGWPEAIRESLRCHDIVQCFQTISYCDENRNIEAIAPGFVYSRQAGGIPRFDPLWGPIWGCPGGAWAFRAKYLPTNPFYDHCVAGDGDRVFAHAILGKVAALHSLFFRYSQRHADHILKWSRRYQSAAPSVSCAPLHAQHIWHGPPAHRSHMRVLGELKRRGFDPAADLQRNGAVHEWTDRDPLLREAVERLYVA